MSINGTPTTNMLVLSRLSVDWMKPTGIEVKCLAAFIDTNTGKSRAWTDGTGIVWSKKTAEAMEALRSSMEEDIAAEHMGTGATDGPTGSAGLKIPSGLGEHLGTTNEPPSV